MLGNGNTPRFREDWTASRLLSLLRMVREMHLQACSFSRYHVLFIRITPNPKFIHSVVRGIPREKGCVLSLPFGEIRTHPSDLFGRKIERAVDVAVEDMRRFEFRNQREATVIADIVAE